MTADRIKEIQQETAFPDSVSVCQALLQVWNECEQENSYSEADLREAFKGGGKMSWTDINQETQESYYYDFKEWFKQFKKK